MISGSVRTTRQALASFAWSVALKKAWHEHLSCSRTCTDQLSTELVTEVLRHVSLTKHCNCADGLAIADSVWWTD